MYDNKYYINDVCVRAMRVEILGPTAGSRRSNLQP